jgi:hypothetical protein
MFGLGLMTIPGIGKKAINTILTYYKTYRCIYDHLKNKFNNDEERIDFLK